jgi:hypothetical protein
MRLIKLASILAALGAIAVLAIAAASASATVLCKAPEATCKSENQYLPGTAINASITSGTVTEFKSALGTFKCTGATLSTTVGSGTPLAGTVKSFGQSGCTADTAEGSCSSPTAGLPASSSLSATESGNGTLSIEGAILEYTCKFKIIGTMTCRYSAAPIQLALSGGAPATLSATKLTLTKQAGSGGSCSSTGSWTASLVVSSPNPLYVSGGTAHTGTGTALCSQQVNPCPTASRYAEGQSIEATSSNVEIVGPAGSFVTFSCTNSSAKLTGQVGASTANSVLVSLGTPAPMGCTSSLSCSTTVSVSFPNGGEVTVGTAPDGSLRALGSGFTLTCGSLVCKYAASVATFPIHGGSSATLVAEKTPFILQAGSSGGCGSTATVNATFTFKSPSPLYLTSNA